MTVDALETTIADPASRTQLDAPSAIFAASYLIGLNQLVTNVQPIILGALADGYHLNDAALGQISAAFIGTATLTTLTGPLWVRRVDWRLVSLLSVLVAAAIMVSGAAANASGHFLLLFGALGLAKGCVGVPSFASLGDGSNPERGYSVAIVAQSLISAAAAVPLSSYIIPHYGVSGLFLTLAVASATGVIACRWLPASGALASASPSAEGDRPTVIPIWSKAAVAPAIALAALAAFTAAVLAYWFYVERIGVAHGIAAAHIGMVLSVAALSIVFSSGLAAWAGTRISSRTLALSGCALLLVAFALVRMEGLAAFAASNLLFSIGWGLAQPAFWAVVRRVDTTARLFVAAGAAQGLAGVGIGLVAGSVIEGGGYDRLMWVAASFVVGSLLCLGLAGRVGGRPLQTAA